MNTKRYVFWLVTGVLLVSLPMLVMKAQVATPAFAAAQPIKIGWFGPLSGPRAFDGNQALKGAKFAVNVINDKGGVLDRPLELVVYDSRGQKTDAITVARRLSDRDQVLAVLGGDGSVASVPAAIIFNQKEVPLLISYASAYSIVKDKPWVFRWGQEADVEGALIAQFITHDLKLKKVALLTQDEEYGRGIANGLKVMLPEMGGQLVFEAVFPVGTRDFRNYLIEANAAHPQVLVGTGFGTSHVSIVKQGTELGIFPAAKYVAPCTISELGWYDDSGPEGTGVYGVMEFSHSLDGQQTPQLKEFLAAWWKQYPGLIPDHYAALSYESVMFLADAIKRGGVSREGIRKGLASAKGYLTLDGQEVSMAPDRELIRPMFIGQYSAKDKVFKFIRWGSDPRLLDPTVWAKYYK